MPLPYHVVVCTVSFATAFGCLSLTIQLLLFRKNHARLACSVVNALTTARCRHQLLRIADSRKGCPYGMILNSIWQQPKAVTYLLIRSAGASPCPTLWDMNFNQLFNSPLILFQINIAVVAYLDALLTKQVNLHIHSAEHKRFRYSAVSVYNPVAFYS